MEYIGYLKNTQYIEQLTEVIEILKQYGCSRIHIEQYKDKKRTRWQDFIDSLADGDCAVFLSFDNVFSNYHDMMFFIKYCTKMNIRIISIVDKLDTSDELFPERKTADILQLICKVFCKRDRTSSNDLEADLYSYSYENRKLKRYKLVINMYKAGYSVKEIMERTGYRGKSNIYRILHKYDIKMEYPSMSRAANKEAEHCV